MKLFLVLMLLLLAALMMSACCTRPPMRYADERCDTDVYGDDCPTVWRYPDGSVKFRYKKPWSSIRRKS